MTEPEDHYTVFIRLPFARGDFVDPPPVAWSATKERELWEIISRQARGNEIDWRRLAAQFEVTEPFLLQQAAWLYERQLSQVRAQMRRMGSRQSATASPVPLSTTASAVGTQPPKRGSVSSRTPSRLSLQPVTTVPSNDPTTPATPGRSRMTLPVRTASSAAISHARANTSSRPLSRKSSKDHETSSRTQSRRGSVQYQVTRSPIELEPPEQSSSEEEEVLGLKPAHKCPSPAGVQRRQPSLRKSQHARNSSISHEQVDEETEDDDAPAFLPLSQPSTRILDTSTAADHSSATVPTQPKQPQQSRPIPKGNTTSEHIPPITSNTPSVHQLPEHSPSPKPEAPTRPSLQTPTSSTTRPPTLPTPYSPSQQAALATAAGLSPRRRSTQPPPLSTTGANNGGAESSPSMGSSFSDLDDASVTQSALEEALMSNMGSTTTAPGVAAGLGSRVSGIGQALRSRYFDGRAEGEDVTGRAARRGGGGSEGSHG